MIRVGMDKPRILFSPASNDMSYFYPSHYSVTTPFLMELYDFIEKRDFGRFNMKPDLTKEQIEDCIRRIQKNEEVDMTFLMLTNPWEYELRQWLKRSGTMVWQFNAVSIDMSGYERRAVALGDTNLRNWSWFDFYVRYPVYTAIAHTLNWLRKRKIQKEIDAWDTYLKGLARK